MLKRAPANLDKKEDEVLIRAMCDANIPKFLTPDVPLFNAIVQDLFPKVVMQETDYSDFNKEVTKSCKDFSLQPHPVFLKKVTQLQETFSVRFGVMLVGTTGGGKTRCYEVLADLMTRLRN
jgi:dynein heavy chain